MDDEEEELFAVSYQGVAPGVPVMTRDGERFGILEHVLAVPEEDIFDGIVVWTGEGGWVNRRIQRDLSGGEATAARRLELLQPEHLRFVGADRVAEITTGYVRCDLDAAQAAALPPPAHDAPVFYANAIEQAPEPLGYHAMYGRLFGRARWSGGS
jgi:hypothetical protein